MRSDELLAGRYRLVERLGAGGMSVVWRGYDEVLGRPVAIKVLATRLATDRAFRHRIRAEAQAAARLCHPHIANVYDYGETGWPDGETLPYVVMELVDGQSMAARLADGQTLPWRVAVAACAQVAAALAVAHARGVVHRDVTLGNVMLTGTGAKVVDFGISALVGERDADADGGLLGTPAFLAPERMDGAPVSAATDVYALGLLLYRTLTGRLPWYAATTTQMLRAHRYVEPSPLPPIDGLPPEVEALCERCLAKDPTDRPSSADVARELAAALGAMPLFDLDVATPRTADDAAALATATTGLLPWSTATGALPASVRAQLSPPPGPHRGMARRYARVLVTAGLAVIMGVVWAGTRWSPDSTETGQASGRTTELGLGPRPGGCAVEYRLQRDTGSTFAAKVAVKNVGSEPFEAWELSFDLAGDQRLHGGTGGRWSQHGRTVMARAGGDAALAPGATARLAFSAGYRGMNSLPVAFEVSGNHCTAVVVGTPVAAGTAGTAGTAWGSVVREDNSGKGSGGDHSGKGENRRRGSGKGKKGD